MKIRPRMQNTPTEIPEFELTTVCVLPAAVLARLAGRTIR